MKPCSRNESFMQRVYQWGRGGEIWYLLQLVFAFQLDESKVLIAKREDWYWIWSGKLWNKSQRQVSHTIYCKIRHFYTCSLFRQSRSSQICQCVAMEMSTILATIRIATSFLFAINSWVFHKFQNVLISSFWYGMLYVHENACVNFMFIPPKPI